MFFRLPRRLFFVTACVLAALGGYGQAAGPGCTNQFYRNNYNGYGNVTMKSLVIGPDASMYMGCLNGYNYSIIKVDSLGDTVRCRTYVNGTSGYSNGRTLLDYDGKLFSTADNFVWRTDTAGNVLSGSQLAVAGNLSPQLAFLDMQMLASGDKVFLYTLYVSGSLAYFLVVTNPDASIVKWTKYFSMYGNSVYSTAAMLADGDKVVLAYSMQNAYSPSGNGLLLFDGASGSLLQQHWYTDPYFFKSISRYNSGYIIAGMTGNQFGGNPSFYFRTDLSLNPIASRYFPSATSTYPSILRAQSDGSLYMTNAGTQGIGLVFIDAQDSVEWGKTITSFYQGTKALVFAPSGIFIGSDWGATDVITGGPLYALVLDKATYGGYFPSCDNPADYPITASVLPMTAGPPVSPVRDTTGIFVSSPFVTQEINGPAPGVDNICQSVSGCSNLALIGDPAVCTGSGKFIGRKNAGCLLPVNWAVTRGPGKASIQAVNDSTVSVSFDRNGDYMLSGLVNADCGKFGDSVLVHVNVGAALSLGNDTTLCTGDSLVLQAGTAYSSYTWQDGSAADTFTVKAPGLYSVGAQDYCGHSLGSQINVAFRRTVPSPFPLTATKCMADTLSLAEPEGFNGWIFTAIPVGANVNNTQIQFFNQAPATYHLLATDIHGCRVFSDITVNLYAQPVLHIGNDTTICPGDSIRLDAGSGWAQYTWSSGSAAEAIRVSARNSYSVRAVTADGCPARDTMILSAWVAPVVALDHDSTLCAGSVRQLSAGSGPYQYLWNDGSVSPALTISETGVYRVTVTDGHGCRTSDSAVIKAIIPLPADFLPGDTTLCQYGKLILTPKGNFRSYVWNDGNEKPSLAVSQPGLYYVQVTDKFNCVGSDSIYLTGKQCMVGFYIPNAFTPNGDGRNDVYRPLIFGNVEKVRFIIFNRYGQKVYETSTLLNGWDGSFHGAAQPPGVYVWTCVYQLQGQESQTQKGTVLVIR